MKEENKFDRFDLEQSILKCWSVTEDIELLYENVMENDELTKDDIANTLLGIQNLCELKFAKMWDIFGKLIEDKKLT
jgi:hypothetical protein